MYPLSSGTSGPASTAACLKKEVLGLQAAAAAAGTLEGTLLVSAEVVREQRSCCCAIILQGNKKRFGKREALVSLGARLHGRAQLCCTVACSA
jgi:hypothetical protein